MKQKALLLLFYYERLRDVFLDVAARYPGVILTDFSSEAHSLPKHRFISIESLIDSENITSRVETILDATAADLGAEALSSLEDLPYHRLLEKEDRERIHTVVHSSVKEILTAREVYAQLSQQYEIECVVSPLSALDKNRGYISAARERSIPSLHIHHGSFAQPDYRYPEYADVAAVADQLNYEILQSSSTTAARFVVSGLPFVSPASSLTDNLTRRAERQPLLREKLGIPADHDVVLYLGGWMEGKHAAPIHLVHTLVDGLTDVIRSLADRTKSAPRPATLIVRPHPSIRDTEHPAAYETLGRRYGFSNIKVWDGPRDDAFDIADVAIVCDERSSVVLDALASACPVLSLRHTPFVYVEATPTPLENILPRAFNTADVREQLGKLLDIPAYREKIQSDGCELFQRIGRVPPDESRKNLTDLICGLAADGLAHLDR